MKKKKKEAKKKNEQTFFLFIFLNLTKYQMTAAIKMDKICLVAEKLTEKSDSKPMTTAVLMKTYTINELMKNGEKISLLILLHSD